MDIIQSFNALCSNADFISVYNERMGTNLTRLTMKHVFSTGSLYHCVSIKFGDGSGELRICDGYHDIMFNNQLYIASGDFLDVQNSPESKEINNNGMSVKISNVRPEYIQLIRNKKFDRAIITISMVFLSPQTGQVQTSFGVFRGQIDSSTIRIDYGHDEEMTSETEIKINNFWEVLNKCARYHASDGVHRSYAGNSHDTFFQKIGKWNSEAVWMTKK
ncbi:hypothetical protein ACH54D_02545 [Atlantibacter hermannii]|uniref:hypothetical protein n=1 Tax=Atlantibacter hermannii TaxID=565 RepID=UPI0037BAD17A